MRGQADIVLRADLAGILPDNRVIAGQRLYGEPFADLTADAAYVRGVVSGLDRNGVGVLRTLVARPELKRLLLIVAVYPGSRTWDDVLSDLLGIQDSAANRVQFRLLARRVGPDRPANLLWISVRRWRAWPRRHGQCRQPPGLHTLGFNGRGHVLPAGALHSRRRAKVVR